MSRGSDAPVPGHRELMRLHLEALYTHDAHGRMVAVNVPGGGPAPRVFLGRTADGNVWRVRYDVPADVARSLGALCMDVSADAGRLGPLDRVAAFEEVLARSAPIERVWTGPAFHFPARLEPTANTVAITSENRVMLEPHFGAWLDDVPACQPFLGAVSDGQVVSVCASVRTTRAADEAGVETHPSYLRRGHAARAVAAWAAAVRAAGRIPLYSTSRENTASQAVAARLALVQFGSDLHIT